MRILYKCPECGGIYLTETWLKFTHEKTNTNKDEYEDYFCPQCHQSVSYKELASMWDFPSNTWYL